MKNLQAGVDRNLQILMDLKEAAGSHSPAPGQIVAALGFDPIEHDHCFLSNPYATELILDSLMPRVASREQMFKLLESYPAPSSYVAGNLSKIERLNPENMVVTNGAITSIDWVIDYWNLKKLFIPIPTFSTYYELASDYVFSSEPVLDFSDPFQLLEEARKTGCDSILLINPNNPTGASISVSKLHSFVAQLGSLKLIIDDSFSHFLSDFDEYSSFRASCRDTNVVFIKSMSKDFGVAGLRLGYLYTSCEKLLAECRRHLTWNLNNFAVLFSDLIVEPDFHDAYEKARNRYNKERDQFCECLTSLANVSVQPSQANFFILYSEKFSQEFVFRLLLESGVYVRTMADKVGLGEKWIRVASRTSDQNAYFIQALKAAMGNE